MHGSRINRPLAAAIAAALLSACAGCGPAQSVAEQRGGSCEARVILIPSQSMQAPPDDSFVTSLARAAQVRLTFLRSVGPDVLVFSLAAEGDDPGCAKALERLEGDPRVRSVEIDAKRTLHDDWRNR